MGAGQIGGIATLLDMDFKNPAGFLGDIASRSEAQHVVHYLSHSMLFCLGAIIEAHVIITPAICVFGERYKFGVFGGTNRFLEFAGIEKQVSHVCLHKGYNRTKHWSECAPNMQLALMMTQTPFSFHDREEPADYIVNRVRYGSLPAHQTRSYTQCVYHGFGSRRNGYLIPLLIDLRSHKVTVHPPEHCATKWNHVDSYLCIDSPPCLSEKYGALCPDDVGSIVVCDGVAKGMMISRLVDRPCGTGFIDLEQYRKFIMCGVDDSREVLLHDEVLMFDFTPPSTPFLITPDVTPLISDNEYSIEKIKVNVPNVQVEDLKEEVIQEDKVEKVEEKPIEPQEVKQEKKIEQDQEVKLEENQEESQEEKQEEVNLEVNLEPKEESVENEDGERDEKLSEEDKATVEEKEDVK
ncbi:uncharacterized protein LOC106129526 [Amyelois transitella]|uniref:uncharacterized protein LOC106129526 n=1 Tax=Amyelois transitella TaxID=680683 RepID=UPI00067BF9C5|nr:uncharacterized protein LOC106129526 [Amyelois transitella]